MKMKNRNWILLSLVVLVFAACQKDESKQPTIQLEFNTVTSGFSLSSAATNKNVLANSLGFSSGQIILEGVEFETSSDTDTLEVEFKIESFISIDYATGKTNPDISHIEIKPGRYDEIEIELDLWGKSDQPSISLNGTWNDLNGNNWPVKLLIYSDEEFSLEIEGDFLFEENTTMIAQITFDPGVWFSGVSPQLMSAASIDDEGVIVISPEQNQNIYDIVKNMMELVSEVEIKMQGF
jgi:hypothetical protein